MRLTPVYKYRVSFGTPHAEALLISAERSEETSSRQVTQPSRKLLRAHGKKRLYGFGYALVDPIFVSWRQAHTQGATNLSQCSKIQHIRSGLTPVAIDGNRLEAIEASTREVG